jgi:CubicO group peptidase (beta-lactamase class C family)
MNQQRSSSSPARGPGRAGALSDATLAAFEADVEAAMQTFQMLGAAVALVQDTHIVYARGFGVRDLQSNAPVSPHTRFRIASNTKSMTSLLAATFVDQGVLDWNAPVIGVWPEFLAPTPALTQSLGLRDLLGMGSGIAESPTIEFFMSAGTQSALDQLRSIAYLPVIARHRILLQPHPDQRGRVPGVDRPGNSAGAAGGSLRGTGGRAHLRADWHDHRRDRR